MEAYKKKKERAMTKKMKDDLRIKKASEQQVNKYPGILLAGVI